MILLAASFLRCLYGKQREHVFPFPLLQFILSTIPRTSVSCPANDAAVLCRHLLAQKKALFFATCPFPITAKFASAEGQGRRRLVRAGWRSREKTRTGSRQKRKDWISFFKVDIIMQVFCCLDRQPIERPNETPSNSNFPAGERKRCRGAFFFSPSSPAAGQPTTLLLLPR